MAYGTEWVLTDAKNLREDETAKLFAEAKKHSRRGHLMVVLAYNGAMRVSELVHVRVSDFRFEAGKLMIIPLKKAGKKRIKGNDGKMRTIEKPLPKAVEYPMPEVVMEMCRKYIKDEHLSPDSFLFPGRAGDGTCNIVKMECAGGHITKRGVQKIFDRICTDAKIKVVGRGMHSLKHGRLTEIAKKEKDPFLVRDLGRHSSVALSNSYVKYVELQEKVNKIGGRV